MGEVGGRDYCAFCQNDPVQKTDPFGLWTLSLNSLFSPNPNWVPDADRDYEVHILLENPTLPEGHEQWWQVTHGVWVGLTDKCELKEGEDYTSDVVDVTKTPVKIDDKVMLTRDSTKWCMFHREDAKLAGFNKKDFWRPAIANQPINKLTFDLTVSEIADPKKAWGLSYHYENQDNCMGGDWGIFKKEETLSVMYVGTWGGAF